MNVDLSLFNSYELGSLRAAFAAEVQAFPTVRWNHAYRRAATTRLVAIAQPREGVWGDPRWRAKHDALRAYLVASDPDGEDQAPLSTITHLDELYNRVLAVESSF